MHDEDKLHQEMQVGQDIEILLQNERLKKAFDDLKKIYLNEMINTKLQDDDARRKCYELYHTVNQFEKHLEEYVTTGKLAKQTLKDIKKF
tara:strand:- start:4701 stop:4970 length:270 start_codon:yes stop_codon:yes gene_type:complete